MSGSRDTRIRTAGPRVSRPRDESGFSLIELLVAMTVLAIVSTLTFTIVTSMSENTVAVNSTLSGLDQASFAGRAFTQYVRSADSIVSIANVPAVTPAPTFTVVGSNLLEFTTLVGMSPCPGVATSPGVETACSETVLVAVTTTASPKVDDLVVIFGYGASTQRQVAAFDVVPPAAGAELFSYYTFTSGALSQLTLAAAQAAPTSVQAIGLDLRFLPPPGPAVAGFAASEATEVKTVIFLRNPT